MNPRYQPVVFQVRSAKASSIFLFGSSVFSATNTPGIRAPRILFTRLSAFLGVIVMLNLFLIPSGWAFEIYTHRDLTDEAIDLVKADLNTYLIENLGLEGGLNASVTGGTPRDLMKQGSMDEDTEALALRVVNHFHDPLSNSGLALSAITWSLLPKESQFVGGNWSWNDAREYYYKALTSETKEERDENWGKTFEALGHIMHLIQDMASPAHVRSDPHLSLAGFDDVDGLHDFMDRQLVNDYAGSGIGPDTSILEQEGATRAEPFSNLFDHNVNDDGLNPSATLGGQAGLAEYANANFFSDDRIPGQIGTGSLFFRSYPYPSLGELIPESSPSPYLTLPRLGAASNSRAAKLTGNEAVAKFLLTHTNLDLLGQLQLDDAVYDAQSRHLIPRAVGYSAAVLDYFFRGELGGGGIFLVNVDGGHGPNGETLCDEESPSDPFGELVAGPGQPPASLRAEGTVSYYFDHSVSSSEGTRELYFEGTFAEGEDLPFPDGEERLLLANFIHKKPVRWTAVIQGKLGPGVREGEQADNAIVAKTGLAEWEFECDH